MKQTNQPELTIFNNQCAANISTYANNINWKDLSSKWIIEAFKHKYMYNFQILGRPIIQTPIDIIAMQELIWSIRPDLIIETGIAHGGSLIFSASMLALLDMAEAIEFASCFDPKISKRKVLGIDIDIRSHNRLAIEAHPMASRIQMIQGSSIDPNIIKQVKSIAEDYKRVLVCLDSNHTHEHVLAELEAYAPLISIGSYCIVFDTIIEDMPDNMFPDRPWSVGNNPKTAVWEYTRLLKEEGRQASDGQSLKLEMDLSIEHKLLITVAPNGYLKRIS